MTTTQHKSIILIDDDPVTNFINTKLISLSCEYAVTSFTNGLDALSELRRKGTADLDSLPDLIFLDINMPQMDGWEFLEEFQHLPESLKGRSQVIMLSSSVDRDDSDRSKSYKCVSDFISKPLTTDKIKSLAHNMDCLFE